MPVLRVVCVALLIGVTSAGSACAGIRVEPPPPAVSRAPAPMGLCFGAGAVDTPLTAADGVPIAAARLGTGPRGIVLINEEDGNMCRWARYAAGWAAAGYHVLAFDLRCHGRSGCVGSRDYVADTSAAVAALRAAGATRVVLVGASVGAAVAVVTAAHLPRLVHGVVSLSARGLTTRVASAGHEPRTPLAARSLLRVPLLFMYAEHDRLAMPAREAAEFVNEVPSPDKRLVVFPGTVHGTHMLLTGGEVPVHVDAFLTDVLP
ncbi:alpha/beta fold hydrolase [Actinomycetes bacterium KLBMP 9797]